MRPRRARRGPRSWCSCERPKRSASSTSMTVAFGTSTPTSITVVATSTCTVPPRNAAIIASFSFDFIWPCSNPTRRPRSSSACSRSYSAVAAFASTLPLSSTSGHTTYAWCPASTWPRRCSHAAACSSGLGPTTVVAIGVRPGGISRSSDWSRSPYTSIAAVRGIGVAVITRTSGSSPLPRNNARCSTPKRCCSSTTASPRRENCASPYSNACVPTRMSTSPASRPAAMRRRSAAVVRFVSSSTRTGRSASSEPSAGTWRPSSIRSDPR